MAGTLASKGYAGTLDPTYLNLLKAARQSTTAVMATAPHEQQSATLLHLLTMLTRKGARKISRKADNNGVEAYRQLCLVYGTSDHEGSAGQLAQITPYKFASRDGDLEKRPNEFLDETTRWGERYRSRPDQARKACIISNTSESLRTHL